MLFLLTELLPDGVEVEDGVVLFLLDRDGQLFPQINNVSVMSLKLQSCDMMMKLMTKDLMGLLLLLKMMIHCQSLMMKTVWNRQVMKKARADLHLAA